MTPLRSTATIADPADGFVGDVAASADLPGRDELSCRVHRTRRSPEPGSRRQLFVLVHGLGMSHRYFDRLQRTLIEHGDTLSSPVPAGRTASRALRSGATPPPSAAHPTPRITAPPAASPPPSPGSSGGTRRPDPVPVDLQRPSEGRAWPVGPWHQQLPLARLFP